MSHWEGRRRGFGPGGHRFERGDLRYVLLELLQDRPSYGYELIRALEERFHGFYTPSPGTVYPTLQWLQDLGYVTVSEQDGRKVYTITDEGRRFLAAGAPRVEEIWERMRGWWGPFDKKEFHAEMRDFMHEVREMMNDIRSEARWADPEKLRRVREVAMRAGRDIRDILHESTASAGQAGTRTRSQSGEGTRPGAGSAQAGTASERSSGEASGSSTGGGGEPIGSSMEI